MRIIAARSLCLGGLPRVMVTATIFCFLIFFPKSLGILDTRPVNIARMRDDATRVIGRYDILHSCR